MSLSALLLATLVFLLTLTLVLLKPRGIHEAFWALGGAATAYELGLVGPADLRRVIATSHEALLFLVALLFLSKLVERSGFFEWAAVHAARRARGDTHALFRNVFVLGALITATLSLDTTALLLTPLVLAFVKRLRLPARPFVILCALVANAGSLLLPVSNLTNLIFVASFHLPFAAYAARMLLPQLAVLVTTYALARGALRRELPARFEEASLGEPDEAMVHRGFFRACQGALLMALVGDFVAPAVHVPTYAVTFALACGLLAYGIKAGTVRGRDLAEVPWGVVPFALGLFVVVQSFAHAGLTGWLARAVDALPDLPWVRALVLTPVAALAANALNNLPAALLAEGVLQATQATQGGAPATNRAALDAVLLGVDVGPTLLAFASLATMLVLGLARNAGEEVSAKDLLRAGLRTTPLALAAAAAVVALQASVFP